MDKKQLIADMYVRLEALVKAVERVDVVALADRQPWASVRKLRDEVAMARAFLDFAQTIERSKRSKRSK